MGAKVNFAPGRIPIPENVYIVYQLPADGQTSCKVWLISGCRFPSSYATLCAKTISINAAFLIQ